MSEGRVEGHLQGGERVDGQFGRMIAKWCVRLVRRPAANCRVVSWAGGDCKLMRAGRAVTDSTQC